MPEPEVETLTSLEEAKTYLQITHDTDDTLITSLLEGIEAAIQENLYSSILTVEAVAYIDGGGSYLLVPYRPLDEDAELTIEDTYYGETVDEEMYRVIGAEGKIFYNNETERWPEGYDRYKITYTGGLELRDDYVSIVARIKIAELQWLGDLYFNRKASTIDSKIDSLQEKYALSSELPDKLKSILHNLLDNTDL